MQLWKFYFLSFSLLSAVFFYPFSLLAYPRAWERTNLTSLYLQAEYLAVIPRQTYQNVPQWTEWAQKDIHALVIATFGPHASAALKIMQCESGGNPRAIGDNGNSRGLWQISKIYHPEVSDAQAFNPEWSTQWAAKNFKVRPTMWSCYRKVL